MSVLKKQLELENKLLPIVLHNIQSPLRFIATIMHELTLHRKSMNDDVLQEHIQMVKNSVTAMQHYCNKISAWNKQKKSSINATAPISLNEVFDELKVIYFPLFQYKKIKINIKYSNIFYVVEKEILFNILLNIIDNAYKNTSDGIITLKAIKTNIGIKIVVSDTGKGMSQKLIDDILNGNYQLKQSSLGYLIITDLLCKINGSLKINSKPNEGTTVTINLSNPEIYDSAYQGS